MARAQAPGLRLPFLLAPLQRRSRRLLLRRLRQLGVRRPEAFVGEPQRASLAARLGAAEAEYLALAPGYAAGSIHPAEGALLYALVRALAPDVIVETGTANGSSTAYILAALHANGAGRLVSVDLPFRVSEQSELRPIVAGTSIDGYDASPVPPGKEPGWMVPDDLRDRWQLRLGDATVLLPDLLAELGEIDVFFHDSLHTHEHMLFEFGAAWPHLRPSGVLVADDVFQRKHEALPAFARSVERPFATFGNFGFVRK